MRAVEILERCRAYERDVERLKEKLERYLDSATRITSVLRSDGGGGSGMGDSISSYTANADAVRRQIQQRTVEYQTELACALALMDQLPEINGRAVYAYYIRALTISAAAQKLGFSESYIQRLRKQALSKLKTIDPAEIDRMLPGWYLDARREAR